MCVASASFSSPRHDGLDGNFIVHPVSDLDEQGNAERCDIIVDVSKFPVGSRLLPGQPVAHA